MPRLAFFSSKTGNTRRFVEKLKLPCTEIPVRKADIPMLSEPFVLVFPTYADGAGRGAVPKPVIHFLNIAENRAHLAGVIAGGNRSFGETFAIGGSVVASKCNVPLLYRFELAGTDLDVARVQNGVSQLWKQHSLAA